MTPLHRLQQRSGQALDRAKRILDSERGPINVDDLAIARADRPDLELTARARAREILTSDEVRRHLADLEADQRAARLDALGLAPERDEPVKYDEPTSKLIDELLTDLHRAATLAHHIPTAPDP